MFHRLPLPRRTKPRRWQPLTDAEWSVLLPFALVQDRPGRPLKDARRRMDAIFWVVAAGCPWREVPDRYGRPDTVSRHFRRLCHLGLWERLLKALSRPDAPPALRAAEHWICAACRRATRLLGMRMVTLARRIGFLSALKAPTYMLPDMDLSERVHRWIKEVLQDIAEGGPRAAPPDFFRQARLWLTLCGGRVRIPRIVQPYLPPRLRPPPAPPKQRAWPNPTQPPSARLCCPRTARRNSPPITASSPTSTPARSPSSAASRRSPNSACSA